MDARPLRGTAPREVSSRSSGVSASLDQHLWGGATSPWALSIPSIEPGCFLSALEMSLMDFPAFYRSYISFLRASDNPPGRPNFVTPASSIWTTPKNLPPAVLRRPVELAAAPFVSKDECG